MEWISVKDKMPYSGERVLVFRDNGSYIVAYLNLNQKWCDAQTMSPVYFENLITHWAQLPEPPTERHD